MVAPDMRASIFELGLARIDFRTEFGFRIYRHNIRHTYTRAQASTLVHSVTSPKSEDLSREASSLCTVLDAIEINIRC